MQWRALRLRAPLALCLAVLGALLPGPMDNSSTLGYKHVVVVDHETEENPNHFTSDEIRWKSRTPLLNLS